MNQTPSQTPAKRSYRKFNAAFRKPVLHRFTVVNGFVVALNVTEGAGAYSTPPPVTFSGDGGSGHQRDRSSFQRGRNWI
jgi:hypothetical protein